MGLGAAGILEWQTAVAFSLGADLGTTITLAGWRLLNLSKNAKRAAYAHISFNFLGVAVMLPLFFFSMQLLEVAMQWFGGDPGIPVMVDGKETYPLVPVAIGLYSTGVQHLQHAAAVPLHRGVREIPVPRRPYRSRRHRGLFDAEISRSRFLGRSCRRPSRPCSRRRCATSRPAPCSSTSRAAPNPPRRTPASTSSRSTSSTAISAPIPASLFREDMPYDQLDLVASLIEEGRLHRQPRRIAASGRAAGEARDLRQAGPGDRRRRAAEARPRDAADHAEWRREAPQHAGRPCQPSPRSRSCGSWRPERRRRHRARSSAAPFWPSSAASSGRTS